MSEPEGPSPPTDGLDPTGAQAPEAEGSGSFTRRFTSFWHRHRSLFWTVHSLWALATGVFVVYLARERYAFVPWVEIVAHELGFRVWDSYRPERGPLEPGLYEVVVRTGDDRLFGRASVELTGS